MNHFRPRSFLQFIILLAAAFTTQSVPAMSSIELRPAVAKQGQTVEILVSESSPESAASGSTDGAEGAGTGDPGSTPAPAGTVSGAGTKSIQFRGKQYQAFPLAQSDSASAKKVWRALVGVPVILPAGSYAVKFGKEEEKLKVVSGGFGVQSIRLPPGKDNFVASPGEEDTVDAAKGTVSPRQFWQGKFQKPLESRISSPFGLRRRVNGKLLPDYFHSGLDFAAGTGTPVKAVQKGKVLIARTGWKLHGNTVCIDHGQGVLSFYIHLSKVLVKEGDLIDKGQKIGAVGATGRANGPHLHFSIYVNKDATNPYNWFANAY